EAGSAARRDAPGDALAHASAHLVGILAHPPLGRRDADGAQQALHALAQGTAAEVLVEERRFRHLPEDREERVQRGHRVLEDHGDPAAADAPQLALALPRQILALEQDAAADDAAGPRQKPDDRETCRRLAAPRPPDAAQRLALAQGEADAVHRLDDTSAAEGEE